MPTAKDVLAQLAALAGENEAVVGSNNTTVNKYFGAPGQAYCGYSIWYAVKKAGSHILDGCSNPAYVPTIKEFLKNKHTVVKNDAAQAGDIGAYKNDHVFMIWERISGNVVITLEGNATVYKTVEEARASASGSGAYEGIGFKKRTLDANYTVYRPAYDGTASVTATDADPVKEFQKWLGGVQVDGKTGCQTLEAALKKVLWVLLDKKPLKKGAKGDAVYVLQGLLYSAGHDPKGLDGDYGTGTVAAVKAAQRAKGLTVDGEAGPETFFALFGWS